MNREVGWAWICLALVPVAVVVSLFVGEGLLATQGYEPGGGAPPWGAVLRAGIPAVAILVAPAVAGLTIGVRACHRGAPGAVVPALIGGGAVIGLLAINLLGFTTTFLY